MHTKLHQTCHISGTIDETLDQLYDLIDEKFTAGHFEEVNRFLNNVRVKDIHTDILMGILTATLPAKNKLPARETFMAKTEAIIRERHEWEEGMGKGLE